MQAKLLLFLHYYNQLASSVSVNKSVIVTMEEGLRSKRRRVFSIDPDALTSATFAHKYTSSLLPALLRATNGSKTTQIEKIVRYEVDMALVSSTGDFRWSRALKHELEEGNNTKLQSDIEFDSPFRVLPRFEHIQTFSAIPRPIVVVEATMPRNARRAEEELACRIRVLRRIMPGGYDMSVYELLCEVESYVFCLQLQVDALRSLVDAP